MSRVLPALGAGQHWCCGGCGSGIVTIPRRDDSEHSREILPNGDVAIVTTVRYEAPCCGSDLLLWDGTKQDFRTAVNFDKHMVRAGA